MPDTGSPPPILGLEAVIASMVPLVGGKAANLGELLAAGLPVPDGFCLTTEAYRQATAGQAPADGSAAGRATALDAHRSGGPLAEVHASLKATPDGGCRGH